MQVSRKIPEGGSDHNTHRDRQKSDSVFGLLRINLHNVYRIRFCQVLKYPLQVGTCEGWFFLGNETLLKLLGKEACCLFLL